MWSGSAKRKRANRWLRAIRQACTVANLKPAEISRVCVGLAGAARPEIAKW